jgi:hypothetical protein
VERLVWERRERSLVHFISTLALMKCGNQWDHEELALEVPH